MDNLRKVADAIVETVQAVMPEGAPAGHLYAALMQYGCTLEAFEKLMAALVLSGRITKKGHLYFAPTAAVAVRPS